MFNIIIKEMKDFFRDKTNLFFFLMFPVALIFLLGNLLGNMDKAEETVGDIKIHYLVQTENQYQRIAIESFFQAVENHKNLIFEEVGDLDASKILAGKDEITAVVVFTGDPLKINVYEGTNRIKNRTVGALMNSFVQTNRSISAVIKTVPGALNDKISSDENFIQQKDLGIYRTMMDYYAISMLSMICFNSIILGSINFVSERQGKTINRLIITPQNRIYLFLQKILGVVPQVILQISVLMFISVFVFKAHYASNLQDNLYLFMMFFIISLAMVSIGVVIGLLIKMNPIAIIMPVLWIMMFFGGTYSKELNIAGFSDKMPIYQLQQAAFDLTVFGRHQKADMMIIISILIMIVMLVIGALIFSKKEEER